MPDKSVLDLSRLQEAFEDDVAGIADLLEMALGTGSKHVAALRGGIAEHDLAAVSRAAHSIKGSSSNVGANCVARLATEIESRARCGDWVGIAQLALEVENAYADLRVTVAAYRATVS
ncbi:MAG: Hpt domain-containing protein [Candidatus Velthaea sp.]